MSQNGASEQVRKGVNVAPPVREDPRVDQDVSYSWPAPFLSDIARNTSVMIIDGVDGTRDALRGVLERAGYRRFLPPIDPAGTCQQLLDEQPDLVLLDSGMSETSAAEILSFVRASEALKYTPVIVLTPSDDSRIKREVLRLGATNILAKPVDESELVLCVHNALIAKRYVDQQTRYDQITGLANRSLFMDRLERVVSLSRRTAARSALLLINIDRFKKINDSVGHALADELLRAIADRLRGLVRADDVVSNPGASGARGLVAHMGGDEFTVLFSAVPDDKTVSRIAERLLRGLAKSFWIRDRELFVTASIGIAVFPEHGADRENLLKHADVAMSDVKRRGRNGCRFYSSSIVTADEKSLTLENELRKALDRQEFVLHYQPKVDVRTGLVMGAETLVRWEHPERGLLLPGEFIATAEDVGLIGAIGDWILTEACRQNILWHAAGLQGLTLAVNVSGHQFLDTRFVSRVRQILTETGLPPRCLTLELTEGVMIEDAKENIAVLHALKDMGVIVSVDDFGTGYSSLSYLEQFPLNELKIDRSFISKIGSGDQKSPIVSAIIAMAHSLRFSLVAEGVETEEQLDFLRQNNCEYYQGYLFSKPLPADAFAALAANWRPEVSQMSASKDRPGTELHPVSRASPSGAAK